MAQTELPAQDEQPPRPRPVMRWALILSLALNLVFVGMLAGAFYRHAVGPGRSEGPGLAGPGRYAAPYVIALPPEARHSMMRSLRREMTTNLPPRQERRAHYARILEALRQPEFDRGNLESVLAAQQDMALRMQARGHEAWLATMSEMSASERQAYADRLEEVLAQRAAHHRGGRHERRGD